MPALRKYDRESGEYKQVAYEGYKAQRAAMPEDLAQQIPYIRRALEAYRIPILEVPGFEADDVIGTLAAKAPAQSLSGLRGLQRQRHAAAGRRARLRPEPAQGQPDLRPRQGRGDSRRAARARGGRHGPARRRHR